MPNEKLAAEHKKALEDAKANVSDIPNDQLLDKYTNAGMGTAYHGSITPDDLANLAALIASKDNDEPLDEKEQSEDAASNRYFARQLQDIYGDELRRRGFEPTIDPRTGIITAWKQSSTGDTGHYDDGHALGWSPKAPTPDPLDTGHYDDGHAFGWKKQGPAALPVPLLILGFGLIGLVLTAGLVVFNRPATVASDVASAAPTTALTASPIAASAGASTRPNVADPCTLVTTAEAAAILERSVTPTNAGNGFQCTYKPQPPAQWSLAQSGRTASIRIDSILITVATGADAQSRYAAKQAIYGKDPTSDDTVSGLGDKAIFTAGTEVSVLLGTKYVNVRATGDYDWGDGAKRYEDVHQKLINVLAAFARTALTRM